MSANSLLKVTTLVPRLPPAVDGLGDYGLNLARQLRQDFHITTDFIVGDPSWVGDSNIEGFVVKQVKERSQSALLELLPQDTDSTLLLHYVGYGYAKRGCPVWLIDALEQWRQTARNRRLVTMFHEIYAFSPDLRNSQFWTSWLQKRLATRLAVLTDGCLTSKQGYAEKLYHLSGKKQIKIPAMPVFSNVGEPQNLLPLEKRSRRLVVFGGRGPRTRVYVRSRLALERTCQALDIQEILDIGPPLGFDLGCINGKSIRTLGVISTEAISQLLSEAMVGFFDYSIPFLGKSTIFAAYCAHQVIPIGAFYPGKDADGLERGKHYWFGDRHSSSMTLLTGQCVADNAHNWYQAHSLLAQSSNFATCLLAKE